MKMNGLDFKAKEDEIKGLNERIESLKTEKSGLVSERDGFKDKASKYDDVESKLNDVNVKLRDLRLTNALNAYDPKNVDTLKRLIDVNSLEFNDDEIKGLDDIISTLKESDSYLFEVKDADKGDPSGMKAHTPEPSSGDGVSVMESEIDSIFNDF